MCFPKVPGWVCFPASIRFERKPCTAFALELSAWVWMMCAEEGCMWLDGWGNHGCSWCVGERNRMLRTSLLLGRINQSSCALLWKVVREYATGAFHYTYLTDTNTLLLARSCHGSGTARGGGDNVAGVFLDLANSVCITEALKRNLQSTMNIEN